ncbi:MAG: ABC transporter substrate-binding protein [Candidatus Methanodesulfokora sp.]
MNRRGITTPVLAVLLIVVLLVGIGIGYAIPRPAPAAPAAPTAPTPPPAPTGLPKEIPIGVINAQSGSWGSSGIRAVAVAKVAEKDINDFVKALGLNVTFKFYYEDDASDPNLALQKAQSLAAKGIKVIFGSLTSGETRGVAAYANSNKIILMASASTAPREKVAPPGGYVFRIVAESSYPDSESLVNVLKELGIKYVVMVTADVTYSLAIKDAFKEVAKANGITVLPSEDIIFPADTKDFTPILDQMEKAAAPYIQKGEKVAVFENGWEPDLTLMLTQAAQRKSPLLNLQWIAPDTIYPGTELLKEAGTLATKVRLVCVQFTSPDSPIKRHVVDEVKKAIGEEPDIWALASYDAAWVIALSTLLAGKYDADAIKTAMPLVGKMYWGATGNCAFNDKNDRATQNEEVYAVIDGQMKLIALYDATTKAMNWIIKLPPL